MKFKTDFVAEDYSELCWFQARKISTVLAVLLSMAIAFTVFGLSKNLMLGIVLLVVCVPLMLKFQKNNVIKRADRRYGAFGASSELYLEINDNEIYQTAASGETRLPWEDVYAVRESDNCYYVFLTKNKAFYFPKRSFESEEQKKEFLSYIEKKVPEKKVKLKK
ncbi:MAG: YcxB family protein [Oscillospiraceae bacterium]|nr:YcxB family protein [Oscillospiraceae bacterium]MBQ4545332.1 YcxB family protein [Oscillospiraceae bacterium]